MTFHQDLREASKYEYILTKLFQEQGFPATLNTGTSLQEKKKHDFLAGGIPYEVKTDIYSLKSQRVCIEQPTLEHTQSQYLIYVLPRATVISLDRARELYMEYPKVPCGDTKQPGVLIPINTFLQNSVSIWEHLNERQKRKEQ